MFSVCHVRAHVLLVQYQFYQLKHIREIKMCVAQRVHTQKGKNPDTQRRDIPRQDVGKYIVSYRRVPHSLWTVRGARVHLYYPLCALTQTAFPPLSC